MNTGRIELELELIASVLMKLSYIEHQKLVCDLKDDPEAVEATNKHINKIDDEIVKIASYIDKNRRNKHGENSN